MTVLTAAMFLAGCKKAEEIRQYSVEVVPPPAATHRMLVAIVPDEIRTSDDAGESGEGTNAAAKTQPAAEQGAQAWFFKLVAPIHQADGVAAAFDQFARSIRTGKEGLPEWSLPEGWVEDPAGRAAGFGREATIRIGEGDTQLELTVSKLPMPKERREGWMLGNVNRWREQMSLPPIGRSELEELTDELEAGEQTATKVDLAGTFSGPPVAGNLAAAKRAHEQFGISAAGASSEPAVDNPHKTAAQGHKAPSLPFELAAAEGWKPGRVGGIRAAAFSIEGEDGKQVAEVTVTPLGPGAGDLKANVDRWREELGLAASKPEELEGETRAIEIDGQKADYVHLVAPEDARLREATLGVILRRPDRVWFFKLRGAVEVVAKEKERFEEFVKSVKFK